MNVTVLVNRGSGTVKKKHLTAESLRELFQKAGTGAEVRLIPGGARVRTVQQRQRCQQRNRRKCDNPSHRRPVLPGSKPNLRHGSNLGGTP